jgi:hypothetical protein
LITHSDDGPEYDPDDPLTVIMRPPAEYLGAPPGRYEAIRRGASRRRMLRAAAGAAVTCGVAALIVLPLRLTASEGHGSPTVPLAPPPASSPSTPPHRPATPEPSSPDPSQDRRTAETGAAPTTTPTRRPAANDRPSPSASAAETVTRVPSMQPSAARTGTASTPSAADRRR